MQVRTQPVQPSQPVQAVTAREPAAVAVVAAGHTLLEPQPQMTEAQRRVAATATALAERAKAAPH
jgi:GH24 family phage-related lysozyme (muramidase)